ncbi:epoxyqueuosine reductase QueH [Candidatus Saccharibacteria bacterium]|nr:epoxyqueuosine reductase QueH [Candidatus Saccharibacteria bacterium]
MKLLLHTCCAPCSVYCLKTLRQEGIEPTLFWYNPNIHPLTEYQARRDCLKDYAKSQQVELILEDNYGLDEFVCAIASQPDFAEAMRTRCQNYCYPKRLRRTFEYAKRHGYDAVSTTLLYSIYQQHDILKDLMEQLAKEYQINFLYRDFREGWHEGQTEARELNLYIQKYCGCIFSEEEAIYGRQIAKKLKKQGIKPTNQNIRKIISETPGNLTLTPTDLNSQS